MKAEVIIRLKKGVTDPEGSNVLKTLGLLGIEGIKEIKFSRMYEFYLDTEDEAVARGIVEESCRKLLSNPVINDYEIRFVKD